MSSVTKSSKRHSSADQTLLDRAGQLIEELEDTLIALGMTVSDDGNPEDVVALHEGNPNASLPTGTEVIASGVGGKSMKAISLDEMIGNVRSVFYNTFRNYSLMSSSSDDYPYILSVYPDFVISKCGMCYHKVPYTIGDNAITFTTRDMWEEVEPDWVAKSVSGLDAILRSVKSVGEGRLGMYLVMYGDDKVRDLSKEFFTEKTQDMLNVFKAVGKIPTFYHHGLDETTKSDVVGMYDVMVADDIGIWAETQLDRASKYYDAMVMLSERGALGSSSGCLPASRKVNKKSGEIERWTIIEGSLTPTPMDYRQRLEVPVAVIKSVYDAAGLTFPVHDAQELSSGDAESRKKTDAEFTNELEILAMELELLKLQFEVA